MPDHQTTSPLAVKKSYKAGCVGIAMRLSVRGWTSGSAKIEAATDLTTEQARMLAQALIDAADKAEAKVDAKSAADARRQEWRNREIAAGRMVVMGGRP
nr:hypothetical protein [uncultured Lichenicoccus sp.]